MFKGGVLNASKLDAAFLSEVGERAYCWWWVTRGMDAREFVIWYGR
jgi:hypothetical protein